ncbi:MAG: hypothetical protein ACM3VT_20715 [Solirubrobacterales bacterium]
MNAKCPAILLFLAWGCLIASSQAATHVSEATARLQARVEPQFAVSEPVVVAIDLQDRLIGSPIPGEVQFAVRANTRDVEFQVACTDLCKAGDPTSEHKIPVAGSGAEITRELCGSRILPWRQNSSTDALPGGWTGRISEVGVFTAPVGRTFNQEVAVEVSWQATDSALPMGEYQGIVRLIGLVRP